MKVYLKCALYYRIIPIKHTAAKFMICLLYFESVNLYTVQEDVYISPQTYEQIKNLKEIRLILSSYAKSINNDNNYDDIMNTVSSV